MSERPRAKKRLKPGHWKDPKAPSSLLRGYCGVLCLLKKTLTSNGLLVFFKFFSPSRLGQSQINQTLFKCKPSHMKEKNVTFISGDRSIIKKRCSFYFFSTFQIIFHTYLFSVAVHSAITQFE